MKAVAKMTVDIFVDAATLHDAEEMLDAWLPQDDDRLRAYQVDWSRSDWVPEVCVPVLDEVDA